MKPRNRIAMTITAAGEDDPGAAPAADPAAEPAEGDAPIVDPPPATTAEATALPVSPHGRFHALIIVEGETTNDFRRFENLQPRETPFWPLMADDENHEMHLESVLVGNFDTMELRGVEWHGWGSYLSDPDERALSLIGKIKSGELRGISADVEVTEFEVLFPLPVEGEDVTFDPVTGEPQMPALPTEVIDGQEFEVLDLGSQPIQRVSAGFIMGATALTFPAFAKAFIEHDGGEMALAASGAITLRDAGCTGAMLEVDMPEQIVAAATATAPLPGRESAPTRFSFPDIPPAEWFDVPETPGPMPLTILDSGQVFGHLAIWGECHIGLAGECVSPPASASNYSRFHVGEIPVAPDGRVSVGRLTFATGHADLGLGEGPTKEHYDNSGTVAADLRATDGEFGIWVCGAMRSKMTLADVREVMSSPPSGDWRRWGRDLELVAALSVNVPGFNTPRSALMASGETVVVPTAGVKVRKHDGLVEAMIVSHPAPPLTAAGRRVERPEFDDRLRELVAASIGRTARDRVEALRAEIRGGR